MRSRCIIKHQKTKFWSFVTFLEVVLLPLDPAQTSAEIQQFWIGTKNSHPTAYRSQSSRYSKNFKVWMLLSSAQHFLFVPYPGRSNPAGNTVFISRCWKRGLLEGWPGARAPEIRKASPSLHH